MDYEERIKLLEKQVSELQQQLTNLKQVIFNNVVTIDQASQLFSQFDDRISKLEAKVLQLIQMLE